MFRKIAALVLCGAVVCVLTGCAFGRKEKEIDPKRSPSRYVDQMSQNIKDYLMEGDVESLYELFGEYYGVTVHDVQKLLNFIDGKIVSINNDSIQRNAVKVEYGIYSLYGYGGHFTISTENRKEYICHFTGYAAYDDEPKKVGLEELYLRLPNDSGHTYWGIGEYFNDEGKRLDRKGNVVDW